MVAANPEPALLAKSGVCGCQCGGDCKVLTIAEARTLVEELARSEEWQKVDRLEERIENHPASYKELRTHHIFTPGIYVREVVMRAGDLLTTRIHLSEHPFIISMGRLLIWTAEHGVIEVGAPYTGITKPGTRRIIYLLEDTVFSTIHANPDNETDPEKIMDRITYNNRELREKTRATHERDL